MQSLPSTAQQPVQFSSSALPPTPQAGSPSSQMVLPGGLASTPMALPVRGSSSGKARCLARAFIKYLCSACCVPGPVPPIHCPVSWLPPSAPPSAAQASASSSSQQQFTPSLLAHHFLPGLPGFCLTSLSALQSPLPLLIPQLGSLGALPSPRGQSLSLGLFTFSCSPWYYLLSCNSRICLSSPDIFPVL